MRTGLAAVLCVAGCVSEPSGPTGVAYLRISAIDGGCGVTQALFDYPTLCPSEDFVCGVNQLSELPFERQRSSAAFSADSRFEGGTLLALGWQAADGTVGRMQLDLGPQRGFGASIFPWTVAPVEQSLAYWEWKDGERGFSATQTLAIMDTIGRVGDQTDAVHVASVFAHAAFDGVAADGSPQCRVVAIHAERDIERFETWDPSWFEAVPGAHIANDDPVAPTYAGDFEPTTDPLEGDDPADGAPPMPFTYSSSYPASSSGGSGHACD